MTDVNELLPFATAVGAGVMDQAAYEGLPARLTGFIQGLAEPLEVNKVWRQSAFNTAMIGQFTMHNSGFDTLDDGDVDTYEDHFTLAIQNIASKGVPLWLVAGGSADALTATVPASFVDLNSLHGTIINLTVLSGYNTSTAPTLTLTRSGGSAFAAKPIVRRNNTPLRAGEIGGFSTVTMAFDQTIQAFRLLNRHGGSSIIDPGTGALEINRPPSAFTGASRTFNQADRGLVILRSNGGASMADTLPGGAGVMPVGWNTTVRNNNFTGVYGALTITPSGGALLDGSSFAKTVYPYGSTNIISDGTNYWTVNDTDINYFVTGSSNGSFTAGMVWPGASGYHMAVAWGAVSGMTPGLTAHITLPLTYQTASFMITVGTVGAGGPVTHTCANQTVSGFDIQNTNPTYSGAFHWHTFGLL
jgi:hypothetical protein